MRSRRVLTLARWAFALLVPIAACGAFSVPARGEPCPKSASPTTVNPAAGITDLTDAAMNAAVETVNQDVEARVENKLGSFRLTTQMLALEDPTKEAMADWYFNMVNLNRLAFQEIKDLRIVHKDEAAQRLALFLVQNVVSHWLDRASFNADHEEAHADAMAAFGYKDVFFRSAGNPSQKLTIGELFLEQLAHPGDRPYTDSSDPNYTRLAVTDPRNTVISAAGINQQERLAELMADEAIDRGGFDATEALPYLENKLILAGYIALHNDTNLNDGSDPIDYAKSLEPGVVAPGGVPAALHKMAAYSVLTAALSGRTWEGLSAAMKYVKTGDTRVNTLKIKTPVGDVLWPEFSTYLNARSVTVKMDAAMRMRTSLDSTLLLSVEQPVIGDDPLEVSAGARVDTRKVSATLVGVVNARGGYGARTKLVYRFGKDEGWDVYSQFDFDKDTVEGDRENFSLDSKPRVQIYGGIERNF